MMALANIDNILVKLQYNEGPLNTTISNIEMDSAAVPNSGLGPASYVEECECPVGYTGTSCEVCEGHSTKQISERTRELHNKSKITYKRNDTLVCNLNVLYIKAITRNCQTFMIHRRQISSCKPPAFYRDAIKPYFTAMRRRLRAPQNRTMAWTVLCTTTYYLFPRYIRKSKSRRTMRSVSLSAH